MKMLPRLATSSLDLQGLGQFLRGRESPVVVAVVAVDMWAGPQSCPYIHSQAPSS